MPVAAKIGGIARHGHHVSEAGRYVAVAPRADVGLHGLIGLHAAHLNRPVEPVPDADGSLLHARNAHATSAMVATTAATTNT